MRRHSRSVVMAMLTFLIGAVVASAIPASSLPPGGGEGDSLLLARSNESRLRTELLTRGGFWVRSNNPVHPPLNLISPNNGMAPIRVTSQGWVANLNVDLLDGLDSTAFSLAAHDHDAAYLAAGGQAADADLLDGFDSAAFSPIAHDHDGAYLGAGGQAVDSDMLDGQDSAAFADTGHDHDAAYLATDGKATDADQLDGKDSTEFSDSGHAHDAAYLAAGGKATDSDLLDGQDSAAFAGAGHDHDVVYTPVGHNHNADYLGINAKADDADLLDGQDSTAFAGSGHGHDPDYLGVNAQAFDSDMLDGQDSTAFAGSGHDHAAAYLAGDGKATDSDLLDGQDSAAFAGSGHDHNTVYTPLGHNHGAEYYWVTDDNRTDLPIPDPLPGEKTTLRDFGHSGAFQVYCHPGDMLVSGDAIFVEENVLTAVYADGQATARDALPIVGASGRPIFPAGGGMANGYEAQILDGKANERVWSWDPTTSRISDVSQHLEVYILCADLTP